MVRRMEHRLWLDGTGMDRPVKYPQKIILKEHVQIETLQKNDVLWENVV
jgi:hypothetical protein